DERLGLPPPLQGSHRDEPPTIPEATAASGGPPAPAWRRPRRGKRRLPRGIPRRLPLQSGVQEPLRHAADARRRAAARSRHAKCRPLSRNGFALALRRAAELDVLQSDLAACEERAVAVVADLHLPELLGAPLMDELRNDRRPPFRGGAKEVGS